MLCCTTNNIALHKLLIFDIGIQIDLHSVFHGIKVCACSSQVSVSIAVDVQWYCHIWTKTGVMSTVRLVKVLLRVWLILYHHWMTLIAQLNILFAKVNNGRQLAPWVSVSAIYTCYYHRIHYLFVEILPTYTITRISVSIWNWHNNIDISFEQILYILQTGT